MKKNNRLFVIFATLTLFAMILFTGCSQEEDIQPEEAVEYEIALVTDDSLIMDGGHSQATWQGITEFGTAHGISHKYYKATEGTSAAYEEAIKTAINSGAKIVIGDERAVQDAIFKLQKDYPEIFFALIDSQPYEEVNGDIKIATNTAAVCFDAKEDGFLAGYAAVKEGYISLGFIGEGKGSDIDEFEEGFKAGAEAANEEGEELQIETLRVSRGVSSDSIRRKASNIYEEGAEVIFVCGRDIQKAVIEAAEASDKPVMCSFTDQSMFSDKVITSAEYAMDTAVKDILEDYIHGDFPGGRVESYNSRNEGIGLEMRNSRFNHFAIDDYHHIYSRLAEGEIQLEEE